MKKRRQPYLVLHHAYDIKEDEIIQTYIIIQGKDNHIHALEEQKFYLSIYGDAFIQKLEGKGYIPMNEVKEKYEIQAILIHSKQKTISKRKRP